ncbi:MAG: hypothetical protein ABIR28_14145 [Vicinamibacteria bacterium]
MKTTIELPDALFRSAKAHAAQKGLSLKVFFERAVSTELRAKIGLSAQPAWKKSFGRLKGIRAETRAVQMVVDKEFSRIEAGSWK